MAFSQQGSVGTASRPSTDTTVAEIPGTIVDEENPGNLDDNEPQPDDEDHQNSQDILNIAWGRHGKIYMWIGYVPLHWRNRIPGN